jgi:hypothetical protein
MSPGMLAVTSAAAGALVVVLAAGALPAHSAPVGTTGPTATATPTDTGTPTATPTPTATTPPPVDNRLFPDLVALPAKQLTIQIRDGRRHHDRRLRFSSSLGNIGPGPLEVRPNRNVPCPEGQQHSSQIVYRDVNGTGAYDSQFDTSAWRTPAGCMVFHPMHDHWHFKASASYTLFDPGTPDDAVVSLRSKVSFCLRDTARLPEQYGVFGFPEAYGACKRRTPQGISVGWMDIYQNFLAGQALLLPEGLPDGLYCLRTVVDPINQLLETNNDNNTSLKALAIRKDRVHPRLTTRCL